MSQKDAEEYLSLYDRLKALYDNGLDDSCEADNLRDLMDGPWYRMTKKEIDSLFPRKEDKK